MDISNIGQYLNNKLNSNNDVFNSYHLSTSDSQNKDQEFSKIKAFISDYLDHYSQKNNINREDINIKFINYGETQLVFLLTSNDKSITLLVKQPAVKYGALKTEAENLDSLNKIDNTVVKVLDYYSDQEYELYATPFIKDGRCLSVQEYWGFYETEPINRFIPFNVMEMNTICTSIIAKLVSLYDFNNNQGLADIKLTSGDFMINKDYKEELSVDSILSKLYLNAARKMLKCSFLEYIDLIRNEFSLNAKEYLINIKKVPFLDSWIEEGINKGMEAIESRSEQLTK